MAQLPVPGVSLEQQPELLLLAMLIDGEARGESALGKLAVGLVVQNRLKQPKRFGASLREVILHHLQFSCMNPNDPNRWQLMHPKDDASWGECAQAAHDSSTASDITHGATHYLNPSLCDPSWAHAANGWVETARIGKHVFGRAA